MSRTEVVRERRNNGATSWSSREKKGQHGDLNEERREKGVYMGACGCERDRPIYA